MGHYDDRELHSASVGAFRPRITPQGLVVGVSVEIHVGSRLDATHLGPGVTASVGMPATNEASLREIQDRAAELALDLIRRMARATPDELWEALATPDRFGDMGW